MEPYKDVGATADRLLSEFESLPWTYSVTVPLPPALAPLLAPEQDVLKLSESVSLVRATVEFQERFRAATEQEIREEEGRSRLLAAFFAPSIPKWETTGVYIQVLIEGFIGPYGSTPAAADAERLVRAFSGMGIATQLFEYKWVFSNDDPRTHVLVHRRSATGNWDFSTRYQLNETVAQGLRSLTLISREPVPVLFGIQPDPRAPIANRLRNIGTVLNAGDAAEVAIRAGQWLFDSIAGTDELLAFIQAMIVLEILLGTQDPTDNVGIIELIANRFAYSVGTTHLEGDRFIVNLRKIYRIRSQIVHRGKHRLSVDERRLFSTLKWMCFRALDKEIFMHVLARPAV